MKKILVLVFVLFTIYIPMKAVDIDTVWMRNTSSDIYSVSFHPNNKIFATGTGTHVGIWDVATATETRMYEGISSGNSFFSKTGKYLIHSFQIGDDEGYYISTFPQDSLVFTYKHTKNNSTIGISISSDEKYFAITYNIALLQIWDIQTGKLVKQYDTLIKSIPDIKYPNNASINQIEFSPDGTKLAFIGAHGIDTKYNIKLYILDLQKDSIIYSTPIGEYGVIKYSNDGSKIAFTSPNKNEAINIIDLNTKQIIGNISGLPQGIGQMLFSQNDKYLIYNQGSIFIYDIISKKRSFVYDYQTTFETYSLSSDLKYFASNAGPYLFLLNAKFSNTGVNNVTNTINSSVIYPNPINKNLANLSFELTAPNLTSIELYNINGQSIKAIENKYLLEGHYQYQIQLNEISNGQYNLRINSGLFNSSISLIINK